MADHPTPELLEPIEPPELPEGFPPVTVPVGVPYQWFRLLDGDDVATVPGLEDDDVYLCRIGDGGAPPYTVMVFCVAKDAELGVRWPTFPELWTLAADVCLEGAMLGYPATIVGMEPPEIGSGTLVTMQQIGAIRGTPAGQRFELAGAGVALEQVKGQPGGGIQA